MSKYPFYSQLEHAVSIIEGRRSNGRVMPMSGGDFPIVLANGVIDFDVRYALEADNAVICAQTRSYRSRNAVAMENWRGMKCCRRMNTTCGFRRSSKRWMQFNRSKWNKAREVYR